MSFFRRRDISPKKSYLLGTYTLVERGNVDQSALLRITTKEAGIGAGFPVKSYCELYEISYIGTVGETFNRRRKEDRSYVGNLNTREKKPARD